MAEYSYKTTPKAKIDAMVTGDNFRFTILTSRLLRIEYNEKGIFEDRATQTVINRDFVMPEFTVKDEGEILVITTEHIELTYKKTGFTPNSLKVRYLGKNSSVKAGRSAYWFFGENHALDGTARTLDNVNGECPLEKGIISNGGITVHDDSKTAIICEDGAICARENIGIDRYLFCYGDAEKGFDAKACLKDFYTLTGKTPLLPRFVLGNWWSRYYPYTQEEYLNLMKKFKEEDIPFSVAVIDMDWHYVDIDSRYGSGWTGYSWNKELFPDHKKFLADLKKEGLKASLNVHPHEGVSAHEDAYENMAKAMGIDPETEENIPFEIENPKFVENYFKHLHHPMEKEGVDFWWLDWQQGNTTFVPGIDPLWMLNHYHFIDRKRGNNRGLTFSRYAGAGSHRYPIGFSGDSHMTWESLDFQPYFTSSASNIGYGWWSHDIGGHMKGYRDSELMARWYQLGVFSPINRLHSTDSIFIEKEPWSYDKATEASMKKILKLRHELIPYLYTMNYRATEGEPLVQPLYYNWNNADCRRMKNEFTFGSEMLVAPITTPADDCTKMGSTDVYLPEGIWYDFFNNLKYEGNRNIKMFRPLDEMPVLVKAGGIVPMAKLSHINDIENPKNMKIKVYAGADGSFSLYEDDGETMNYEKGGCAFTDMTFKWGKNTTFTISAPRGDKNVVPKDRSFEMNLSA